MTEKWEEVIFKKQSKKRNNGTTYMKGKKGAEI